MRLERQEGPSFVLGMGANGLGVARGLGRYGIRVVGIDFKIHSPGFLSRYCNPLITPDPSSHPLEALRILTGARRKFSVEGVLYPTTDAFVLFVSEFREQLSEDFLFAIPSRATVERILDKRRLYQLAKSAGTPYPTTIFPTTLDEVEEIKNEIEYPVFLKPYDSQAWSTRFGNKGFNIKNADQLIEEYRRVFDEGLQAMVQEIIQGSPRQIYDVHVYFSAKHEPLATFVSRHTRKYPIDLGMGTCVESIHDEDALGVAIRFLKAIRYVGIGELELKKDADGTYKILDLNPRTCFQSIHPIYAGVNLPLIQYLDLKNQLVAQTYDYHDGVKWLDGFQDFRAFYELSHTGDLTLLSWLRSIKKIDCHAYFALDDPKPFIGQYSNNLSGIARYLATRLPYAF